MKKLISSLLVGTLAFSAVSVIDTSSSNTVKVAEAKAKTKAQIMKEGKNKVKKYLYSRGYKKKNIIFRGSSRDKNGNLYFLVYEDRPERNSEFRIGEFKLTKSSNYKKLYQVDYTNPDGKYILVKKFK
ncbi:hypothetical protein [Kurthia huakuii]|uniref:hypothetical protein n=1 Tax=Kurthia huakuii TaxID=1421019 RepID=UPI000497A0E8|nr:hypothetical protein [Kurthia huakuii]MBM7701154.1 hypothetical protein [Kurthia huakuii]